mmetsp:Transcript_1215/g.1710  ORF Transcript_1215/g.1710 Transcript_1215/m.1710 type:complete len:95 (-) Transcript_1215:510-794(-)
MLAFCSSHRSMRIFNILSSQRSDSPQSLPSIGREPHALSTLGIGVCVSAPLSNDSEALDGKIRTTGDMACSWMLVLALALFNIFLRRGRESGAA